MELLATKVTTRNGCPVVGDTALIMHLRRNVVQNWFKTKMNYLYLSTQNEPPPRMGGRGSGNTDQTYGATSGVQSGLAGSLEHPHHQAHDDPGEDREDKAA